MRERAAMFDISALLGCADIRLGVGSARFTMSRGSFKFKDKLSEKKKFTLAEKTEDGYVYKNGGEVCRVNVEGTENGITLTFGADKRYNRLEFSLNSFEGEKFYGCGEQFTHFNLKGQRVPVWVSEHQNAVKIAKKCIREKIFGVNPCHKAKYKNHQTYVSLPSFLSGSCYFVDCDADGYAEINFKKERTVLSFTEIPKSIKILSAEDMPSLFKKISEETGAGAPLPNWVGEGVIIASQGGDGVLLERLQRCESAGIKVAAVWSQDWCGQIKTKFGTQVYWNWSADEKLYNYDSLFAKLKRKGVKFLGYLNPYLKQDGGLYNEAVANGYVVKRQDGTIYHVKSTTFNAAMVDLTNEKAYNWFKGVIKKNLIEFGLDGWMSDFGEYLPTDAVLCGGDAEKLHNQWAGLWQKLNRQAISESGKDGEIFIFNRAAGRNTVPYMGSLWNGDQHVDYSDEYGLGSVVPATLSAACTGFGVCHSDIGGYTTIMHMKRDTELLVRWAEMNAFTPVFRCHEGNRPEVNVQFYSEQAVDKVAPLAGLFTSLKPYRDGVLNEYAKDGLPAVRPLFVHHGEDWCFEEKQEFLFGSDILVCPVTKKGVGKIKARLPQGEWEQLFTLKQYGGGVHEVESPLGTPVAFYKKDSAYKYLYKTHRV